MTDYLMEAVENCKGLDTKALERLALKDQYDAIMADVAWRKEMAVDCELIAQEWIASAVTMRALAERVKEKMEAL